MDQSVISRAVSVAGGRFAPGHLGELTQQVPFEMVDAVLEETCRAAAKAVRHVGRRAARTMPKSGHDCCSCASLRGLRPRYSVARVLGW